MNKRWLFISALAVMMAGVSFNTAQAEDKEENEVKVPIADVPAAVHKTLDREANGEKIETVDKEERHGKTAYEADVKIDGHNYEIVVDEHGLLLSKKLDEGDEKDEKAEGAKHKDGHHAEKHEDDEHEDPKDGGK